MMLDQRPFERDPESLRFPRGLVELPLRLRISHNPGPRLDVGNARLHQHRADDDVHLELTPIANQAERTGIKSTADGFELLVISIVRIFGQPVIVPLSRLPWPSARSCAIPF
jgi:hypothetical protein